MSGLSPVIITVRMPMTRICSKRSRIPGLTVSLSSITPRMRPPSETASGVLPSRASRSTIGSRSAGTTPPSSTMRRFTASAAPLRIDRSAKSTPDIRVWAVNGISWASRGSAVVQPFSCARSTIDRPSGVSSARDDSSAASTRSPSSTPASVWNAAARRLPYVIVPVLSSSKVETSPAASTARPERASTLRCTRRSIPAMPIAESSAPIVVGMRHTSSATNTTIFCSAPE